MVELSPAYDLVNSTLVLARLKEELALPIRGKKNKFTQDDFIEYFAIDQLKMTRAVCNTTMQEFRAVLPKWNHLIEHSFLLEQSKNDFRKIVKERLSRFGMVF